MTVLSALLIDRTLPYSSKSLDEWLGVGVIGANDELTGDTLWIAEDLYFVEIGLVRGDELLDLTLYERSDFQTVSSITKATVATYDGSSWILDGTSIIPVDNQSATPLRVWTTSQTPSTLQKLATSPRNLSVYDQYRISRLRNSGARPSSSYYVWAINRLTMPLTAFGFLLLAVPLMQRFGRRETGERTMIIGIALGFVFFIFDGVFKTLADGGGIDMFTAIGFPLLGLFIGGTIMLLYAEDAA